MGFLYFAVGLIIGGCIGYMIHALLSANDQLTNEEDLEEIIKGGEKNGSN